MSKRIILTLLTLLALLALTSCGPTTIVVNVAPLAAEATPAPPPCPTLNLDRLRRSAEGEIVLLRATWPGPGELELAIEQFALMDNHGATYRAAGDDTEVEAGQSAPVVLTAAPADDAWLVEARLEHEGCPPAVVALPEPL